MTCWGITEGKVKQLREAKVRWLCEPGQECALDSTRNTEPLKTLLGFCRSMLNGWKFLDWRKMRLQKE